MHVDVSVSSGDEPTWCPSINGSFPPERRSPRVSTCDVPHVRFGENPFAALFRRKMAHF